MKSVNIEVAGLYLSTKLTGKLPVNVKHKVVVYCGNLIDKPPGACLHISIFTPQNMNQYFWVYMFLLERAEVKLL